MNRLSKLNSWEHSGDFCSPKSAQGYLNPNPVKLVNSGHVSSCGSKEDDEKPKPSACGAGDDDEKPKPSACGAGDDGKEKPAACASSCGTEGK